MPWRREKKTTEQLSQPSLNPHYKQTHFSILGNNNPFIQPVWNLIIDFRPWVESWEDVGDGKWGGEWNEEGIKPTKKEGGGR